MRWGCQCSPRSGTFSSMLSYSGSEGQLFKQVEGLGMGLPLSPTLANIFMSFHEQKLLADCPPDFAPVFYRRYVDDTFVVFKQESHAHLFFQYINTQHPNISFTAEHEHNNKISFLDVLITKENGLQPLFTVSLHSLVLA